MIGVALPTIPGREESLGRAIESVRGEGVVIAIHEDSPSSGAGWIAAAAQLAPTKPDYLLCFNDDCELIGNLDAAMKVCDAGMLPCPIVRNPDDSIQSAGGDLNAPDHLLKTVGPTLARVGFTTVPFLSWSQWEQIGMQPVHYASDLWVSYRGRQLGIETVLCHGYQVRHWNHSVGRGAGMSQNDRDVQDRAIVMDALGA